MKRASKIFVLCFSGVYSPIVFTQSNCPSPHVNDILIDPVVIQGMNDAWNRSFVNGQAVKEDGFTIYQCRNSINPDFSPPVEYVTELEPPKSTLSNKVDFGLPRTGSRCRLVATFHTHPEDASIIDQGLGLLDALPMIDFLPSYVNEDTGSRTDIESASGYIRGVHSPAAATPFIIRYKEGPNNLNGNTKDFFVGPEVRPSLNWECPVEAPPLTPQPASTGDPHLLTPDGLAYDFQGVGEFVLLRSEFEGFEIQSRQESWGGLGSQVSVNTGFAFNVDNVKVALVESPVDGSIELYIDREIQSRPTDYSLDSGGRVIANRTTLDVRWSDGSRAVVRIRPNWMNLSLALNERHAGKVSGLLGNYNGDVSDDIVTESGKNLTTTPSAKELYGIFADGWRVRSADASHFYYYEGQDYDTFANRLFPGRVFTVDDLSEQQRRDATAICEEKGVTDAPHLENCILDVGLSGDAAFADDALAAQNQQIAELQIAELQGEIGVPSRICESSIPPDVINYAGRYVGTLTQTSRNDVWDYEAEITQCGLEVYGSFNGTLGDAFADRLFEGTVSDGQLDLEATYPHRFDYTPIDASVPCVDFVFTLSGNESTLSGSWAGSNCTSGGEINLTRKPDDEGGLLYLNSSNISVVEGENSTPTLNDTISLNNVINAATANSVETHSEITHIWHTGTQLELFFDFGREYTLETVHFWNYFEEDFDVDSVELSFSDSTDAFVGGMSLSPQLGRMTATESEDFGVDPQVSVRFVRAIITGTNNQSDFLNMGFTVKSP